MIALLARLEREDNEKLEASTEQTVQALGPCYQAAVAKKDLGKSLNICRVFTELGETFLMKIVSSPPHAPHFSLPILDMVLMCCQHPDYESDLCKWIEKYSETLQATRNYSLEVNIGHNVTQTSVTSHNISVSSLLL